MFSLFEVMGEVGKALLDFVYPPHCLGCERAIEEAGEYLCAECWEEIAAPVPVRCERCSCPLEKGVSSCPNCAAWEPVFERAVVMGRFSGRMQQAIHALKFRQQRELGRLMGKRMGREMGEFLREVDLLVPVPLHWTRRLTRGYNQAHVIAKGLRGAHTGLCRALKRVRRTPYQPTVATYQARYRNVKGAFSVRQKSAIRGRCICLVDDIKTSGATLNECAKVLKQAGAKEVYETELVAGS